MNYNESISSTCKLLGVSRQVYYRSKWSTSKGQQTALKVVELVNEVRRMMPRLGTRKLYYLLEKELKVLGVGRDKLFTILKANHMLIKPVKTYHVTTNSHHRFRKHKNLIEDLDKAHPEQVWVADITYVGNRNNPMYLSLITDAYSKKIMGYHLSTSLETQGSIKALKMAIKNRIYPSNKLIHHSDRGLQYCSNDYQDLLSKKHISCSMTEAYDPYQNAIAERVNGILKQEFFPKSKNIDIKTMQIIVKQSVDIYNNRRPHWSCDMLTPNQMHRQNHVKIKSYKNKNLQELQLLEI